MYRDLGDVRAARPAFAAAQAAGNQEARLEYAQLLIEDRDPNGGREMIDALLADAGERPSPVLVLEGARARMLAGDHVGAAKLLELADTMSGVVRWKLDRERGRLALRKSDFLVAAAALSRALEECGGDVETFLLAADVGIADAKVAEKVKKLAPERLKKRPEAKIIEGKQLVAAEKYAEAEAAYKAAKDALKAEKAAPRRLAQADFGLALVAYNRQDMVNALLMLQLVIDEDPSLVDAYVFAADATKQPKQAFQLASKAVQFNPDYPHLWYLVGKNAHLIRDRRALTDAISRLTALAPDSDELKELQALRGR